MMCLFRRVVVHSNCSKIRSYSSQRKTHEVKIPVPWGHIAGKWWEPTNARPILTIHGWQDNCGSFDRLIPLLTEKVGFLAIDLPGHGYSTKLPPGMYYNNLNYPILIQRIANYFNWDKVTLMGHSMGGISCYTYTMLFPQRVDYLVLIDGIKPLMAKNNISNMHKGILEQLKYDQLALDPREPPSYSLEEINQKVADALFKSIDIKYASYMAARNIAESKKNPGKHYFTRDPRLKTSFSLNWPHDEIIEAAKKVINPIMITKFSKSGYFEDKRYSDELFEILKETSRDLEYHYVEGTHHTHLNNPQAINKLINAFIEKHDTENRTAGGIKEEIKQNS